MLPRTGKSAVCRVCTWLRRGWLQCGLRVRTYTHSKRLQIRYSRVLEASKGCCRRVRVAGAGSSPSECVSGFTLYRLCFLACRQCAFHLLIWRAGSTCGRCYVEWCARERRGGHGSAEEGEDSLLRPHLAQHRRSGGGGVCCRADAVHASPGPSPAPDGSHLQSMHG